MFKEKEKKKNGWARVSVNILIEKEEKALSRGRTNTVVDSLSGQEVFLEYPFCDKQQKQDSFKAIAFIVKIISAKKDRNISINHQSWAGHIFL